VLHQSRPTFLFSLESIYCAITILVSLPGNIESIFLNDTFLVNLSLKSFILQILPEDSTEGDSLTPFDNH
jgi:hypothetical protein